MKDGALPTVVWMLLAMHSCAEQSGNLVRGGKNGPVHIAFWIGHGHTSLC